MCVCWWVEILHQTYLNPRAWSWHCVSTLHRPSHLSSSLLNKRLQWMNSREESLRTKNENERKNKPKHLNHDSLKLNAGKKLSKISYGWLIILTTSKWTWSFFFCRYTRQNQFFYQIDLWLNETYRSATDQYRLWIMTIVMTKPMHVFILHAVTSPYPPSCWKRLKHRKTNVFIQFVKRETCWECGEARSIRDPLQIICAVFSNKSSITRCC